MEYIRNIATIKNISHTTLNYFMSSCLLKLIPQYLKAMSK